ncbi:hypothetical protein AAFC00_005984 [Neodothiora populina]|uniref:TOM core complex subunit Tom6 n=1 Tax=Neodothiora populina TaxID=2781224 RepID=A0ABR3P6Y4_9PEZI
MPPKRQQQQQGYARTILNELSSPDNRSVVTAVTVFATGVAFLHSSWSEILLPPL